MLQELLAIKIPLKKSEKDQDTEILTDMVIAPSYIIRSFAEFLADREDDDGFNVKGHPVKFQDCDIIVGDSKQAVASYECLKRYSVPLSTHPLFADLISGSSAFAWKVDPNYRLFEKWYNNR